MTDEPRFRPPADLDTLDDLLAEEAAEAPFTPAQEARIRELVGDELDQRERARRERVTARLDEDLRRMRESPSAWPFDV